MREPFVIRPIRSSDDAAVRDVIRTVMPEFGAIGPGYAIVDPEVESMSAAYAGPRARYFVVESAGGVVGGAGVAPLVGGDAGTCELRKMYLLRHARGAGIGPRLLAACLDAARSFGFSTCYIETLAAMHGAQRLYERHGFTKVPAPLGDTGHYKCDRFYVLSLR